MTEWKGCKLGDIIEIVGGGTPKTTVSEYWNGNIPWLSVVDFNTGTKYVYNTEKTITQKGLENSSTKILDEGDIIISARGTVGALAVLKKKMAFNQSCYGVRNKDSNCDKNYIYYLIKNSISNFQQIAHGGVFDTITRETFDQIDISLPPLPEQIGIANVLSSLDDKMDLLHRQNKTLEGMAETLWRKMFVEEADPKWEEISLLEIIDLVGGGTPKTEVLEYWNGSIPWLSARDITSNHKSFIVRTDKNITELGLKKSSSKILPKFATIISARGTVGNYCILSSPMAFSQSNYGVLPKIDGCYFFTYLLIAHIVEELKSAAYGSVFDTITINTFRDQKITLPKEDEILYFEKEVKYYFEAIYNNTLQIRTLSHLRDTLLPKLMAGGIRVKI